MTAQNQFIGIHRQPNEFDFLKPTNSLFGYFTALVETYTKILTAKMEKEDKSKVV